MLSLSTVLILSLLISIPVCFIFIAYIRKDEYKPSKRVYRYTDRKGRKHYSL